MNVKAALFLFILTGTLFSCADRETRRVLNDIESLVQERPDSALSAILDMDTTRLHTRALRAQYSLLHAIALDKNYIDTTDVRVIQPALDYYGGIGRKAMLANYYAGRIHYNNADYSHAMIAYQQALACGEDLNDYYLGLIHGAMADVYNATYNAVEELAHAQISYQFFAHLEDKSHVNIARYKLAQSYHNNACFREADSLFSVLFQADSTDYVSLLALEAWVDNELYKESPNYPDCIDKLKFLLEAQGSLSVESYYEYAYCLLKTNQGTEARKLMSSLSALPKETQSLGWRYRISELQGNAGEALALFKELADEQDRIVKEQLNASIFKAQALYYKVSADRQLQKTKNANQRSLFLILFSVLLLSTLGLILVISRMRHMAEKERLLLAAEEANRLLHDMQSQSLQERERYASDLQAMVTDNDQKQQAIRYLRNAYIALYQKQFSEISQYYNIASSPDPESVSEKASKSMMASVKVLLEEISGGSSGQKSFEKRINDDLDQIVAKIRKDFPKYDEEDIRFICYVLTGFDTVSIALFMNMTKENVRVKKHRFRNKLKEYHGPNEELYNLFSS